MILLIDNYDSFSYNLYQLIGTIKTDIKVVRNDALSLNDITVLAPSHIVISPGPGKPSESGICKDVIRTFTGKIPIFGVCLGHQAICEVYGATVTYARNLMHGKSSAITLDTAAGAGDRIFAGMPQTIQGARYHSLSADSATISAALRVIAADDGGEVMGIRVRDAEVYGVQFHPESILTPEGKRIVANFLDIR